MLHRVAEAKVMCQGVGVAFRVAVVIMGLQANQVALGLLGGALSRVKGVSRPLLQVLIKGVLGLGKVGGR
jgi:hypothetical protein